VDAPSLQARLNAAAAPVLGVEGVVRVRSVAGVTWHDGGSGASGQSVSVSVPCVRAPTDVLLSYTLAPTVTHPVAVQVEVEWTAPTGARYNRVHTLQLPTPCEQRNKVEQHPEASLALPSLVALREAAYLASCSRLAEARSVLISTLRLLQRGMTTVDAQRAYLKFVKQGERLDGFMRELQVRAHTEMMFGKNPNAAPLDDYASRNIMQGKAISMADWIAVV
jgi:hypothetical protein